MKNNSRLTFLLLLFLGFYSTGCEKIFGTINDFLYSTSFEKHEKMDQWENGEYAEFKSEAPKGGGQRSLFVSGGCVVPHMVLDLGKIETQDYITVKFSGKVLFNGGTVSLTAVRGKFEWIDLGQVYLKETNWKDYKLVSTVPTPIGYNLKIQMSSGGFAAGGMLIDLLEVSELN